MRTASELADDLRHFLEHGGARSAPRSNRGRRARGASAGGPEQPAAKIVPKGLRPFDANDAAYFLAVAGPRDRNGPAREHSPVEGPHRGAGPGRDVRRGRALRPVGLRQVVARPGGAAPAAVRLRSRRSTSRQPPTRPKRGSCKRLQAAIPRAAGPARTWRSAWRPCAADAGRPRARSCWWCSTSSSSGCTARASPTADAGPGPAAVRRPRLQCLLLVRDDFWLALSRFMAELEIELVQGRNTALVDLFDLRTRARAGRVRPSVRPAARRPGQPRTPAQETFLQRAVAGLAQDDKSCRCGWPCSRKWSKAGPGLRRRCATSAAPRASA